MSRPKLDSNNLQHFKRFTSELFKIVEESPNGYLHFVTVINRPTSVLHIQFADKLYPYILQRQTTSERLRLGKK